MLLITIPNLTTSSDQTCLSIIHINKAIKVIVAINHNSQSYNFLWWNLLISYDDENLPKQKINQFDFFDDTDYDDCMNITETNKLKPLKRLLLH